MSAVNSRKYPERPPAATTAPLAYGEKKFAVMAPEPTCVGITVSWPLKFDAASQMTRTVEVVIPAVDESATVCTPGEVTPCVAVVLTVETGQLVPLPVRVLTPPLLAIALMLPAVIVLPEVVSIRYRPEPWVPAPAVGLRVRRVAPVAPPDAMVAW